MGGIIFFKWNDFLIREKNVSSVRSGHHAIWTLHTKQDESTCVCVLGRNLLCAPWDYFLKPVNHIGNHASVA